MDRPDLRVRMLGSMEAEYGGRAVDLGGPRQRAVLALLLVARGEVVSVDRLIDDLWHGEPPPRATGALQAYVSNLRRSLEPDRPPRTPAHVLVSVPPGYAVRLPVGAVDAWAFERDLRRAMEQADPVESRRLLTAALESWRGPALAEFATEGWAAPEAARLEELRLVARERLVDATLRSGGAAEAIVAAEALAREVPLREEVWRLLALAQYATGRQGDALGTLRRARQLLADELGVDPGPHLVQLERDVLAQSVALPEQAPTRAPAPAAVAGPSRPGRQGLFVGRARELDALRRAADRAAPGRPALVLLAGEPGAGKSALLARLQDELAGAGWRVAMGRCPELAGSPPAWAWAEAVRALAAETPPGPYTEALEPLLSDDPVVGRPGDALLGRFRLHRAVADWLSTLGDRPLALVLDDVHRADVETRNLLASLLDQRPSCALLLVLAHRPESSDALEELLAQLARHAPTRLRLAGLGEVEAAELISAAAGAPVDPVTIAALVQRTEGNPFYLTESARLLASEGDVVARSQVPQGVADVLRRRLARLPEESVSVLRLAAVVGRNVDVGLLIEAAEVEEAAVLDALEAGLLSGLLVETGPDTVQFSHLIVQETLYAGIPNVRRTRWHARVAAAVAALRPGDALTLALHSARAATAATPALAEQAVEHCVAAGEQAELRYGYDTAADFYRQALACLDLLPTAGPARRLSIFGRLMPALVRAGNTAEGLEVRKQAIHLAHATGDRRLLIDTITAWNVPTPWTPRSYRVVDDDLVAIVDELLTDPSLSARERCLVLCTRVRETSYQDDPGAEAAAREALDVARAAGDPELIAFALHAQSEVYLPDLHPAQWDELRRQLHAVADGNDLIVFGLLAELLDLRAAGARLDLPRWRAHLDNVRAVARRYELRQALVVSIILDGLYAHLTGELERAEAAYFEAYAAQRRVNGVDADGQLLLALATIRLSQGRLSELTDRLAEATVRFPAAADAYGLALAGLGRMDEARRALRNPPKIYADYLWQIWTTIRALAVAAVGERDRAPELYAALLPYADQVAGAASSGFVLTPVARALGQLAALLDRPDGALAHFRQAGDVARRCGNSAWLAQIERDMAALGAVHS